MAIGLKILRTVVRNEAMRTDPPEIYGWPVFAIVVSSCFGGMLFGWETGAIGGVLAMNSTQQKFGYADASRSEKALQDQNIVSTLQAGAFFACLVVGWLTEKLGRRLCLIGTGVITTIGVVLQTCSAHYGNIGLMYAGRLIAGLGVGASSSLVPLYVSECAPRAIRGGLIGCYQLFLVSGIMLAFWVNYGSALRFSGPATYMVPLALQAFPAVFMIFGMLTCPESPRWCARKDDWERVKSILVLIRRLPADSEYVAEEIREIAEQLEHERALFGGTSTKALIKELLTIPSNRKRAFIIIMVMVWQQFTGVNAVNYYAPQIFANLGMTGTEASLFATGIYGILKVTGVAIFLVFVADTLGRRTSLIWTGSLQAIFMFIIGIYTRVEPPIAGKAISPFGYVAIVCIYLWGGFYQLGWGPCPWILMSEIPTARLRALNVSMGAATQWLFNFVIARTVLTMQATMGTAGYGMFFMFGSFCVIMTLFTWFFIPETKGLSLERMDELFDSSTPKANPEAPEERPRSICEVEAEKN
uniref:Major facilitator superfamily (MFS) profile domain-containing protein n=1 Tax=Bionectria ochroleuca TaxID=29856 RepID=A0A8H7NES5_BIOOC